MKKAEDFTHFQRQKTNQKYITKVTTNQLDIKCGKLKMFSLFCCNFSNWKCKTRINIISCKYAKMRTKIHWKVKGRTMW